MYDIFIDESCHLEHDGQTVMCMGYTKVVQEKYEELKKAIKQIKLKHKSPTEIKWNKISVSRIGLYKELIDFFFDAPVMFRCVLVKNKDFLDHEKFNRGDHDAFYYKVSYLLLNNTYTNPPESEYRIFLDIKDTRGRERLTELARHLGNKNVGDSRFVHFQHIRSDENEFLQLTDLFIGAVSYKARKEHLKSTASKAKIEVVQYLEAKSGYSLDDGTEPWKRKFNIFDFQIHGTQ